MMTTATLIKYAYIIIECQLCHAILDERHSTCLPTSFVVFALHDDIFCTSVGQVIAYDDFSCQCFHALWQSHMAETRITPSQMTLNEFNQVWRPVSVAFVKISSAQRCLTKSDLLDLQNNYSHSSILKALYKAYWPIICVLWPIICICSLNYLVGKKQWGNEVVDLVFSSRMQACCI